MVELSFTCLATLIPVSCNVLGIATWGEINRLLLYFRSEDNRSKLLWVLLGTARQIIPLHSEYTFWKSWFGLKGCFFFFNIILLKSFILIVLISNNIFCFPILCTLCKVKGQWSKMDFVKATKPLQKKIHCIMDALFPIGTEKYPGFSLIFLFCLFDIWCLPEGFVKKPKAFRLQFNGI